MKRKIKILIMIFAFLLSINAKDVKAYETTTCEGYAGVTCNYSFTTRASKKTTSCSFKYNFTTQEYTQTGTGDNKQLATITKCEAIPMTNFGTAESPACPNLYINQINAASAVYYIYSDKQDENKDNVLSELSPLDTSSVCTMKEGSTPVNTDQFETCTYNTSDSQVVINVNATKKEITKVYAGGKEINNYNITFSQIYGEACAITPNFCVYTRAGSIDSIKACNEPAEIDTDSSTAAPAVDATKGTAKSGCQLIDDELQTKLNYFYTAIRIATPVITIVLISKDIVTAVTAGNEDEIKKAQKNAIKRLIVMVIIMLLPTIINTIVALIDKTTCGVG